MCSEFLVIVGIYSVKNKDMEERNNIVPNIFIIFIFLLEVDCPGCPGESDRPYSISNQAKLVILFDSNCS